MEEKNLHTYVKLNPTLLGPELLREILNDKLNFNTEVPDIAFEHDLKYSDALKTTHMYSIVLTFVAGLPETIVTTNEITAEVETATLVFTDGLLVSVTKT